MKDDFGEAEVARHVPEPGKFPSLDSGEGRFLPTHKEVDFALHPVVGFVRQVRDAERLLQTLGLESLDSFSSVGEQVPFSRQ